MHPDVTLDRTYRSAESGCQSTESALSLNMGSGNGFACLAGKKRDRRSADTFSLGAGVSHTGPNAVHNQESLQLSYGAENREHLSAFAGNDDLRVPPVMQIAHGFTQGE